MSPKRKAGASKAKAKPKRKPYRRIATEEAFSIPEQMDAQRELVATTAGIRSRSLPLENPDRSGRTGAQEFDRSLRPAACARWTNRTWTCTSSALTSTGVQMMDPDRGTALATIANDRLARGGAEVSEALRRARDFRAAGSSARREGNRARDDQAEAERPDHQFAHKRRISERTEILADPRGDRRTERARSTFIRARRIR